ncbi:MAG: restriction endonuclease [Candidatus Heimdallarchaeaceae archaeon]
MESKRILREQLYSRNFNFSEDVKIRMGRKDYKVDFFIKDQKIGIITLDWRRTIPVSKILQLERVQRALKLKKLILICNSLSENAKEFLTYRSHIRIQVVHSSQIEHEETKIEDLIVCL